MFCFVYFNKIFLFLVIYILNYQLLNFNKVLNIFIGDFGGRCVYVFLSMVEEYNMYDYGGKKILVFMLDIKDVVYKDFDLDFNFRREQSGFVRIN